MTQSFPMALSRLEAKTERTFGSIFLTNTYHNSGHVLVYFFIIISKHIFFYFTVMVLQKLITTESDRAAALILPNPTTSAV